jgi:hypothetical protein
MANTKITSRVLADDAVLTANIADDQVTLAKMAGLARGKIIYGDSSGNPAALAVGSNGQVLKSDGTDIAWGTDSTVAALTSEEVQDIVGAMFSSNTETGITATYQDGDGTVDLVVGTLNQDTTGTAATVTGAAQSAITSLGTLTALTGGTGDFNWDSGTLFVDSSADNVGVGATSLQSWAKLEVAGTAGAQTGAKQALYVRAPTTTANEGVGIRMSAASGSNEAVGIIGMVNNASGNSGSMTFHTYNGGADIPEAMRIDNTGNVGIGTTSPSAPLHVTRTASGYPILKLTQNGADQYNTIYLQNSDSTAATVVMGTGGGSVGNASWANGAVFGTTSDAKVVLLQNDSAAVTIDTDQKVGIGTASPAGLLTIHKDVTGANDQELLTIRRDGGATSDGSRQASIAFFDGNNDTYTGKISGYRDSPAGNYDGGLRFYVNPHATNANGTFAELNNTPAMYLNPDRSMTTFGDIYVPSGNGINFGSTADGTTMSSELLDDYEEGTWTPTVGGWSNTTVKTVASQNQGHYTKVGQLVTVTANITWNGTETLSGGIIVRGLPYAAKNVAGYRAGGSMAGFTGLAANGSYTNFTLGIDASQTYFYIIQAGTSGYGHSPTVSNSGAVYGLTFTYQTT